MKITRIAVYKAALPYVDGYYGYGAGHKFATGQSSVVVIDTDPYPSTEHGGTWWEVAVPEVSTRPQVQEKRVAYEAAIKERNER